ncbi:RmlC-like cupin [Mycena latifolia]|nr:RmlC-like cupin [Mycena latifolia]
MFSLSTAVVLSALLGSGLCTPVSDLVAQLRLAPTAVDRLNDLPNDKQYTFDFFNPPGGITTGAGGHTVAATSANFPAVVGNGIAMTIGFLGPCSVNTPHTHPRATEINFSVNGTLRTGTLEENGARFVVNELPPGSMTLFPQGAIHFEMNEGCDPAMFVAAFNSEDPGVLQVAQRFFGLPPDIVSITLGDIGVQEVQGLEAKIPDNVAIGTDECLKRCGLKRPPTQPTTQHQPRVSGNAFPPGH